MDEVKQILLRAGHKRHLLPTDPYKQGPESHPRPRMLDLELAQRV